MGDIAVTDIVVIIVTILSTLIGLSRGLAKEILSLLGWVGASLITLFLFPYVEPHAYAWISNIWLSRIATGAGLFILSIVILSIIGNFLSEKVQKSSMSGLDRTFGVFFGIARAWLLLAVIYIAISIFFEKEEHIPADVRGAKAAPFVTLGADFIWSLLPTRLQHNVGDAAKSVTGKTEIDLLQKGVQRLGNTRNDREIFEKLLNPSPSDPSRQKGVQGYNESERKKLNELMKREVQ